MATIDYRERNGLENEPQYHIRCTAGDIAPIVIVPGDQGRVMTIVKQLSAAKKISENRGLITYTGEYEGIPVSVTSTGMGGPAASIVYEELINLGAKYLLRVGSVAALQPDIKTGDISIPYACIRDDGASQYYVPPNYPAAADPILYSSLIEEAKKLRVRYRTGINWTHSAFFARSQEYFSQWARKGVISMEMEASALLVIGTLRGISAAFIGTVFANRINQAKGEEMDLSVKDFDSKIIEQGVKKSIEIALKGAVRAFRQTN
jgi:uridine phosphorylase